MAAHPSKNHHPNHQSITCTGANVTKIDTTPPSKPTLTPSTSYSYTGAFTITWPAATDTGGSNISYYYVAQSSDRGANYGPAPTGSNPLDDKVSATS